MVKKILVVDDDLEDLEMMKSILEKEKYSVVTTDNGVDALNLVVKDRIDLILIDIKMPTLSGYDLLRLLREKITHKVKMVYVSIIPKKEVDLSDVNGFVQKPLVSEVFFTNNFIFVSDFFTFSVCFQKNFKDSS